VHGDSEADDTQVCIATLRKLPHKLVGRVCVDTVGRVCVATCAMSQPTQCAMCQCVATCATSQPPPTLSSVPVGCSHKSMCACGMQSQVYQSINVFDRFFQKKRICHFFENSALKQIFFAPTYYGKSAPIDYFPPPRKCPDIITNTNRGAFFGVQKAPRQW